MNNQLDDLVAEKVMGWTPYKSEDGKRWWSPDSKKFPGWIIYSFTPSQNIYDAWRVLDKLRKEGFEIKVICQQEQYILRTSKYRAHLNITSSGAIIEVMSKEVEKAVCLLALKLKQVYDEEFIMAWMEESK